MGPLLSCLSVDAGCFHDAPSGFRDRYGLLADLAGLQRVIRFSLMDVGRHEAFGDFDALLELVRGGSAAGFQLRLLTTARLFADPDETIDRFRALREIAPVRFVLRLDEEAAAALTDTQLGCFVDACALCGLTADVLFELPGGAVPECALRLVRRIEERRFYNSMYLRKRLPVERRPFAPSLDRPALHAARLVACADGTVLVRCRDENAGCVRELVIGDLSEAPLSELARPERFA